MIQGMATGITTIALFALHVLLGRYLGASQYGMLSFGVAFAAIFWAVFDPGIFELTIRDLSRDKSATSLYVSQAFLYKILALPIASAIAIAILMVILDSRLQVTVACVMFISMWLNSLKDAMRPVFISYERFGLNARILFFERIGLLAVVALVALIDLGLSGIVGAFILWRFIDLGYTASVMSRNLTTVQPTVDIPFLRAMLIRAFPIGAFYLTNYVYNYLDTVMIGAIRTPEEVGWYSAAYRLYEGFMFIPSVIGYVFMPRLSQAYAKKEKTIVSLAAYGTALAVLVGSVCSLGLLLFAEQAIDIFFGPQFENSSQTLIVLGYGLSMAFIVAFLQTLLISVDRQKQIFWCAVIGLMFNAALNLYLIPRYGQLGAAWATVVSLVLTLALLLLVSIRSWNHFRLRTAGEEQDKP